MAHKIALTPSNVIFAFSKLNFTKDYSRVVEGTIMVNRSGEAARVTKIDLDDCGRRQFWSGDKILCTQYDIGHNMQTKQAFYAYEFEVETETVDIENNY